MSSGLIDIMKRAALDATDNAQMCDLRYGTVVSTNPLSVQVTNLFTIPEALLVVPQHLTNYTVSVGVSWSTSSNGDHTHSVDGVNSDEKGEHNHSVSGTKSMTIHNSLRVGDKVALLRKQGGQSYFILDRI